MTALFKKLKYKAQNPILILNAPDEFAAEKAEMAKVCKVDEKPGKQEYSFVLAFAVDVKTLAKTIASLKGKLADDAVLWFAYPKKSSKKYKSDITRDNGWEPMGELNYEPVGIASVDEDWSALRFRKVDKIKTLTRSKKMTLTKEGRKRTSGK